MNGETGYNKKKAFDAHKKPVLFDTRAMVMEISGQTWIAEKTFLIGRYPLAEREVYSRESCSRTGLGRKGVVANCSQGMATHIHRCDQEKPCMRHVMDGVGCQELRRERALGVGKKPALRVQIR